MQNILITGCNRGIGLALTKQYLDLGEVVFGTVRDFETKLEVEKQFAEYPNFKAFELDLESLDNVVKSGEQICKNITKLDIVIQNAGVAPATLLASNEIDKIKSISELDSLLLEKINKINAIHPIVFVTKILSLLDQSSKPKIAFISSIAGSISKKTQGSSYGYSGSKAVLNMYVKLLSLDLREKQISVVAIHPGLVKTRMGRVNSDLSAEESANYIVKIIEDLNLKTTGKFLNFDGSELGW